MEGHIKDEMTGEFPGHSLPDYACITWSGYLFPNPITARETFLGHTPNMEHTLKYNDLDSCLASIRSTLCDVV